MSTALLAALFATLGLGLAGTSAACVVLWRRSRAPRGRGRRVLEDAPSSDSTHPKSPTSTSNHLTRRLDELAGKQRTLEARLARLEAAPGVIAAHPAGPRLGRRVDPGSSASSAGPTLISVPDLAAPPASTSEASAEFDRRFGPVWAMADDAMPIDAIARETGYPIGQVELILGLRRRLLGAEAGPDA